MELSVFNHPIAYVLEFVPFCQNCKACFVIHTLRDDEISPNTYPSSDYVMVVHTHQHMILFFVMCIHQPMM